MAKIDRLGWAAGLSFNCYGVRLGVRVNDAAILGRIPACLPPGWKPARSPIVDGLYSVVSGGESVDSRTRRYNLVYAGAARVARTMDLEETFGALRSSLHTSLPHFSWRMPF